LMHTLARFLFGRCARFLAHTLRRALIKRHKFLTLQLQMDWDIAAHKKRELQKSACASFERSEKQTAMVKRLFGLNILGADSERNEEERTPQAQVIFNP